MGSNPIIGTYETLLYKGKSGLAHFDDCVALRRDNRKNNLDQLPLIIIKATFDYVTRRFNASSAGLK